MKHLLTLENVIYTGQINLSKWSEKDDIELFEQLAKKAKGEDKFFDISGPGYNKIKFVNDVIKYKPDPVNRHNKIKINTGWQQITFLTDNPKQYVYGDDRYIPSRTNGPAKIVKGNDGKYNYYYYYEGRIVPRDIAMGKKSIDDSKVKRKQYISVTAENVENAFKEGSIEVVLSRELFRLNGLPDMELEEFNTFIEKVKAYLLDNFTIKVAGYQGINLTFTLKNNADLDAAKFDKHHKLTTLGII